MEQQPAVEIPPDHPAALLAMLPSDAAQFVFANIETAMERPVFREELEYGLEEFVDDEKSPGAELFRASGVTAMVLGYNLDYDWYCILRGDFTLMQEALKLATTISGDNPSTELIEEHQGVEIFGVFLERSYAQRDVLYLAMPYQDTLVLTKEFEPMKEMVGRRLDGGSLPQPLAVMLDDWGLPDYIHAYDTAAVGGGQSTPLDATKFYAAHVTLEENEDTTLRLLYQFDSDDQASEAAAWLQEQTEPRFRTIGYNKRMQHSQWTQKGPTVHAHITAPDEDALDLIGDVTGGN